jgi:hypothetical protein
MIRAELRDRAGKCVRRAYVVSGSPFVLCLRTHRYYDLVRGAQYVERRRYIVKGTIHVRAKEG